MDVISDIFKPTVPSVMDHVWGFFAGLRQRGVQTTEKMLRKGTIITGIGELISSKDGTAIRLQPPSNGAPFYLTNMQVTSLVRKLDDSRRNYRCKLLTPLVLKINNLILTFFFRLLCVLFGTIGIVIGGLVARRYYLYRLKQIENEKRRKELELSRKERRRRARDDDLSENQRCVVCRSNPREV